MNRESEQNASYLKSNHLISNEDYTQVKSSKSSTPRSKSSIKSTKTCDNKLGYIKPKKSVSFSEDLIQVHLIPFNNYTTYLNIDEYKSQLQLMHQNTSIDYTYDDYDIPNENYSTREIYEQEYHRLEQSQSSANDQQLNSTTEYYVSDPNAQNFPSLLPRNQAKRFWSSEDSQAEKINNTVMLNQRHYNTILGIWTDIYFREQT